MLTAVGCTRKDLTRMPIYDFRLNGSMALGSVQSIDPAGIDEEAQKVVRTPICSL